MCKYDNKGICEITGTPCEDVVLCSDDGVWMDKKDKNEN